METKKKQRKLKVGDKVECINENQSEGYLRSGEIYTIREISHSKEWLNLEGVFNLHFLGWSVEKFKLIQMKGGNRNMKKTFKKGDKVRALRSTTGRGSYAFSIYRGDKYTISRTYEDGDVEIVGRTGYFYASDFRLILVKGGKKKMGNKKYMAIQEGCNNIISDDDNNTVFDSLTEIKEVVESAIENTDNNFDASEDEVIIYELVKKEVANAPSQVTWTKA